MAMVVKLVRPNREAHAALEATGCEVRSLEFAFGAYLVALGQDNPPEIIIEAMDGVVWAKVVGMTHLPVIVDPSHGTGRRDAVIPMARAAVAAGADGIIVEVHPDPIRAKSDGDQSLHLQEFRQLVEGLKPVAEAVGRRLEVGLWNQKGICANS